MPVSFLFCTMNAAFFPHNINASPRVFTSRVHCFLLAVVIKEDGHTSSTALTTAAAAVGRFRGVVLRCYAATGAGHTSYFAGH